MGLRYAFSLLLLLLSAPPRVSIAVTPTVLPAGQSLRLTCTVPKHSDNRWLVMGAYYEGGVVFKASERQLDGAEAPVTQVFQVTGVPCDVAVVQCYLIPATGPQFRATREVVVAGCGN